MADNAGSGVIDAAANYATATHAAATVTNAAVAGQRTVIDGVAWSYSGGTPAGSLTITDGGTTVFSVDVTANGPGQVTVPKGLSSAVNSALVVTLADGGASLVGKVNVLGVRLS